MANKPKEPPVSSAPELNGEVSTEPSPAGFVTESVNPPKEVKVELVLHDARYFDVRIGKEIRRVTDKTLAADVIKDNKLGGSFYLSEAIWEKSGYAPYAKPKKKKK
jgi:hypothetical protein